VSESVDLDKVLEIIDVMDYYDIIDKWHNIPFTVLMSISKELKRKTKQKIIETAKSMRYKKGGSK